MNRSAFAIRSRRQAQAFQLRLDKYRKDRDLGEMLPTWFLAHLFDYAHSDAEPNPRLFSAVCDLELTFLFMEVHIHSSAGIHNLYFAPNRPHAAKDPLLDDGAFTGKIDTLGHMTAFALRCRAFWDKFLGILFLLYDASRYDKFAGARSRKRYFSKHAACWPDPPRHILEFLGRSDVQTIDTEPGIVDMARKPSNTANRNATEPEFPSDLIKVISALDNIRTAEAHGTGTLRNSAFATEALTETKGAWLIKHRNITLQAVRALRRTLNNRCSSVQRRRDPRSGG